MKKAFTLVEMVAALVILTILVGVAVVTTGNSRERALQTRIAADIEAINSAKGLWALDNAGVEFPLAESDRFNAIKQYLQVNRTYNSLADFQPPTVTYSVNALGIPATHSP